MGSFLKALETWCGLGPALIVICVGYKRAPSPKFEANQYRGKTWKRQKELYFTSIQFVLLYIWIILLRMKKLWEGVACVIENFKFWLHTTPHHTTPQSPLLCLALTSLLFYYELQTKVKLYNIVVYSILDCIKLQCWTTYCVRGLHAYNHYYFISDFFGDCASDLAYTVYPNSAIEKYQYFIYGKFW